MARSAELTFRRRAPRLRAAFTLVELLLVVLILGVSLAVIVPRMGGLLDGGKAAVAARTVSQAGRYARTMALLNQLPMELVLDLDKPGVRVAAAGGAAGGGAENDAFGAGAGGVAGFGQALSRDDRDSAAWEQGVRGGAATTPESDVPADEGGGLADEIAIERDLEGVRLQFAGYVDRTDMEDAGATTNGVISIRYRANGACRPHRVVVTADRTGDRFVLDVDAVGTPRLSRDDGTFAGGPQ